MCGKAELVDVSVGAPPYLSLEYVGKRDLLMFCVCPPLCTIRAMCRTAEHVNCCIVAYRITSTHPKYRQTLLAHTCQRQFNIARQDTSPAVRTYVDDEDTCFAKLLVIRADPAQRQEQLGSTWWPEEPTISDKMGRACIRDTNLFRGDDERSTVRDQLVLRSREALKAKEDSLWEAVAEIGVT